MRRDVLSIQSPAIADIRTPIPFGIAIEYLCPPSVKGNADAVVGVRNRRHVANREYRRAPVPPFAKKGQNASVGIILLYPLETFRVAVEFVQRCIVSVGTIEIPHQILNSSMRMIRKQVPIQGPVMIPLAFLRKLSAHEK